MIQLRFKIILLSLFLAITFALLSFRNISTATTSESKWVDSVFNSLTIDQKIGQFFMVATRSDRNETYYRYTDQLIQKYHVGGLIFFQGTPYRQAILTNRYQSLTQVPLFVGIDGEWGLSMRLDSVADFPKPMTLGAIGDNEYIYQMGAEIGRQCVRLGIHVNFAPVADINTNPRNPVIGLRSFGENQQNVTAKAGAFVRGLQSQHVIATAKHFPGHGSTGNDSHFTLPVINQSADEMRATTLQPFRQLIDDGLTGIVTGHLSVPALDSSSLAASLSYKIVTDLLKNQLKFNGLVFTDAMNMRGVTQRRGAVEANLLALMAGNDVLVYPENIAATINRIKTAMGQGVITQELIDQKVKKILAMKYWVGLQNCQNIAIDNLMADINSNANKTLIQELSEKAVTLIQNRNQLIPITNTENVSLVSLAFGSGYHYELQNTLSRFAPCKSITYGSQPNAMAEVEEIINQIDSTKIVVLSLHDRRRDFNRPYPISVAMTTLINRLQATHRLILCVFGSPYMLANLPDVPTIFCAYQDTPELQNTVAQQIFGGLSITGKLPITVENRYPLGSGFSTKPINRLIFGLPEQVGMKAERLHKIDTIVEKAIASKVFPGCQVLVARRGRVVLQKNYGTLTYENSSEKVVNESLYDLASVTKVAATLQAVMFLYEQNQLNLSQKASYYLPELQNTNKAQMTVQDLLLHRSGMVAFYPPLWERTRTAGGGLMAEWYSSVRDSVYSMQVAPKLFAKPALADSVWKGIVRSPLHSKREGNRPAFVYSDLGLVVLQKIVERLVNQPLSDFLGQNFYEPLGMSMTGFLPLNNFIASKIAATENDYQFRSQLLRGTVHDQMAAVLGGIAGHAGLFSCAQDLAVLMQMQLQKGEYGGKKYFRPETIETFAKIQESHSHRGLGWDKPPLNAEESNYVANSASNLSYGHSGFTGTMVWVDPKEELVFVFLSNRVHPRADNNNINRQKIRKQIHEAVYQAIDKNHD